MQFQRRNERESPAQREFQNILKDYINKDIRSQMKENELMFQLDANGNPKQKKITCYMEKGGMIPKISDIL